MKSPSLGRLEKNSRERLRAHFRSLSLVFSSFQPPPTPTPTPPPPTKKKNRSTPPAPSAGVSPTSAREAPGGSPTTTTGSRRSGTRSTRARTDSSARLRLRPLFLLRGLLLRPLLLLPRPLLLLLPRPRMLTPVTLLLPATGGRGQPPQLQPLPPPLPQLPLPPQTPGRQPREHRGANRRPFGCS